MIRFDDALLEELGLGELGELGARMLWLLFESLERRVCDQFADRLTAAERGEYLEQVLGEEEPGTAALLWLKDNRADFNLVALCEFVHLKREVSATAPAIVAIELALGERHDNYAPYFMAIDRRKRRLKTRGRRRTR